jgi:hypothetical protein
MMAEVYERKADKANAIKWYSNALPLASKPEYENCIGKTNRRIKEITLLIN